MQNGSGETGSIFLKQNPSKCQVVKGIWLNEINALHITLHTFAWDYDANLRLIALHPLFPMLDLRSVATPNAWKHFFHNLYELYVDYADERSAIIAVHNGHP